MSKPNPYLQPGRFGPREFHGRPRNGGPDWKRIFLGTLGTVSIVFIGVTAVYGALLLREVRELNTLDIKPTAIAFSPAPHVTETVTIEPVDPVKDRTTILMVGSDSRKGLSKEQLQAIGTADDGSDLTDTIILAQLNPENDQVAMLSMPRDLVIRRCDGTKGRINEAWYIGESQAKGQGATCLIQTIEQHTGIGIDHVMRVNFSGFVNVVDTLGGVDFAVDQDMRDRWSGLDIKKGCNHFDGVKAIQFVRARHIDSDFGRQARQQRFAREMIKKATSLGTLTNPLKVAGLIDSASDAIETDTGLDAGKLADLAWSMRSVTRLRERKEIRDLVRETTLSVKDLIFPVFVVEGENIKEEITSIPGTYHYSIDKLEELLEEIKESSIRGIILFGLPDHKDSCGSSAYDDNGIVQRAIRKVKELNKDLWVIADVCMCQYTDHGHCGIIEGTKIINDKSVEIIAKISLSYARAGADMIAPSDMMDGRVRAIRETLDKEDYTFVSIMSYSAKYSSAFYGPFREAANSTPQFGDRKSYQMDPGNVKEAMREIEGDIEEGADIIMVKPALSYLDVIRLAKDRFDYPIAAYSVSGEYALIKAAAEKGLVNEKAIALEMLLSIKRAGADMIITYYALEAAKWIKEDF